MVRESIGLSADERRVYAKTMRDSVVCYSALTDQPRQLWACDVGFGYEHATVMLPEKDGIVFSSTKNGLIFAIDGKTGRLLWKHKVDRKSTRLNSSHANISYAVFCLKKKK